MTKDCSFRTPFEIGAVATEASRTGLQPTRVSRLRNLWIPSRLRLGHPVIRGLPHAGNNTTVSPSPALLAIRPDLCAQPRTCNLN